MASQPLAQHGQRAISYLEHSVGDYVYWQRVTAFEAGEERGDSARVTEATDPPGRRPPDLWIAVTQQHHQVGQGADGADIA
jgi:hypothetical protein